jgi:hypothetical protein
VAAVFGSLLLGVPQPAPFRLALRPPKLITKMQR